MWRSVVFAVTLGMVFSVFAATPVAAANNVTVLAYFGDCQFAGANAGSGKTVKIEWTDSDGNLKSKHSVTSNTVGAFTSRCEADEYLEMGDVLKTTIGTSVRSFTVPRLTTFANRTADTVFGAVCPAPATLTTEVFSWNGGFTRADGTWHTSTDAPPDCVNYYYASNWDTAPDLKGWDEIYASWIDARGDKFVRLTRVPGMRAWVRQSFVDLVGSAGNTTTVALSRQSVVLDQVDVRLGPTGETRVTLMSNENLLRIKFGDEISGVASDGDYLMPSITMTANKSADKVTADCSGWPPGTGIEVDIHTRDNSTAQSRTGYTSASAFVANFAVSPKFNVKAGDKVEVHCKLTNGDIAARVFTIP